MKNYKENLKNYSFNISEFKESTYNIEFEENEFLLKGKVLNQYNQPIKKAVILIGISNSIYKEDIGYTKTNPDGTFCVPLIKKLDCDYYVIKIYPPLVRFKSCNNIF